MNNDGSLALDANSRGASGTGLSGTEAGTAKEAAKADTNPPKTTDVAAAPAPGAIAPQQAAAAPAATASYTIGSQDILDISVFKVPELSKSVQVADTGTVNLPLVGEIQAVGRTPKDVENELTRKLGAKFLQNPQVTVLVKEYNSQTVTVDGAVKKPGVFPFRNSVSLVQVVTMAGGLDQNSDSTVVVFREAGGKRTAARFDIGAIHNGDADDPPIKPGDKIVVGTSAVKTAFNNVLKALPVAGFFLGL